MVPIPGGPFLFAGSGDPPASDPEVDPERRVTLPPYRIDRTEVTNAQFASFARLAAITGIAMPARPHSAEYLHASEPDRPIAGITWNEARAFCRFMGKDLPSSEQWERALRGGERLPDGSPNPHPRRSFPWGNPVTPIPAKLADTGTIGPAAVGSFPGDRGPEGVMDLAGNVMEWTSSPTQTNTEGFRITRGGDWWYTSSSNVLLFSGIPNQRPASVRLFTLGVRCVVDER
jgi:formylglycine-generating enzyme required for sulfatase activity